MLAAFLKYRIRFRDQAVRLAIRQLVIDFLGDKADKGVQQPEGFLQDIQKQADRTALDLPVLGVETMLGILDVPVAEVVPEEIIAGLGCLVVTVTLDCLTGILHGLVQLVVDPLVHRGQLNLRDIHQLCAIKALQQEPCGVPDLVREIP